MEKLPGACTSRSQLQRARTLHVDSSTTWLAIMGVWSKDLGSVHCKNKRRSSDHANHDQQRTSTSNGGLEHGQRSRPDAIRNDH